MLYEVITDLYLGEPLMLALKSSRLEGELTVEGERDGTPWRHRIALAQAGEQAGLHRLWARRRRRDASSRKGEAGSACHGTCECAARRTGRNNFV